VYDEAIKVGNQLSVREDDVIISSIAVNETITMVEEITLSEGIGQFCTGDPSTLVVQASPGDLTGGGIYL
jgi:hypothetical protein